MEATILGTSSMVPTKDRNHAAVFVSYKEEGILLDCGEGTQRQLKTAGIPLSKVKIILITHWHGDHVLGLPGMVQSMGSSKYTGKLKIFGPKGTKKRWELLKKAYVFEDRFEIEINDVKKKVFFETKEFQLEALELDHTTPCLGYAIVEKDRRRIKMDEAKKLGIPEGPLIGKLSEGEKIKINGKTIKPDEVSFIEKGKKLAYVTDTGLCKNAVTISKNADLLICESTYDDDLLEKAEKYKHLTARQAAQIANQADVKKLCLTHFSQRYKQIDEISEHAKMVFHNTICADDFTKVRL